MSWIFHFIRAVAKTFSFISVWACKSVALCKYALMMMIKFISDSTTVSFLVMIYKYVWPRLHDAGSSLDTIEGRRCRRNRTQRTILWSSHTIIRLYDSDSLSCFRILYLRGRLTFAKLLIAILSLGHISSMVLMLSCIGYMVLVVVVIVVGVEECLMAEYISTYPGRCHLWQATTTHLIRDDNVSMDPEELFSGRNELVSRRQIRRSFINSLGNTLTAKRSRTRIGHGKGRQL